MAFTERYMRLPVEMHNCKEAELTGNVDAGSFESFLMVNPMEIASYRPGFDSDGNPENTTIITFKSGQDVLCVWPLQSFESKVNEFMK